MTEDSIIYRWHVPDRAITAHAVIHDGPMRGEVVCGKAVGYGRRVFATKTDLEAIHSRKPCRKCLRASERLSMAQAQDHEPTPAA